MRLSDNTPIQTGSCLRIQHHLYLCALAVLAAGAELYVVGRPALYEVTELYQERVLLPQEVGRRGKYDNERWHNHTQSQRKYLPIGGREPRIFAHQVPYCSMTYGPDAVVRFSQELQASGIYVCGRELLVGQSHHLDGKWCHEEYVISVTE